MKIAFVVSDLSYPPEEGLHQQSVLLVKVLRSAGFAVDLYGFVKNESHLDLALLQAREGISFVIPPIRYSGSSLLQALRLRVPRNRVRKRMRQLVGGRSYSVVHYEGVTAAALADGGSAQPSVISWVDPGSRRQYRMASSSKHLSRRLYHYLAAALFYAIERTSRFPHSVWHVVSSDDADYLRRVHHHLSTWDIPMALPEELELHTPLEPPLDGGQLASRPRVLIYCDLGVDHLRRSLRSYCDYVFRPSAWGQRVEFRVMGRADLVQGFDGLSMTNLPWIDDYLEEIRMADMVFLPDQVGTGIKTRAIQSLAAGKPVLASAIAFEGIPVVDGLNASVGAGHADFVRRFDELCSDAERRAEMGREARVLALGLYSPSVIANRWDACYRAACCL